MLPVNIYRESYEVAKLNLRGKIICYNVLISDMYIPTIITAFYWKITKGGPEPITEKGI